MILEERECDKRIRQARGKRLKDWGGGGRTNGRGFDQGVE